MDLMPAPIERIGGAEPAGTTADDRDALASLPTGRTRLHPATGICLLNDGKLVFMDRHRFVIHAADARLFAQRGTDTTGKLRKRIGLQQTDERLLRPIVVQFIVPLRDQIVQWTAADPVSYTHLDVYKRQEASSTV